MSWKWKNVCAWCGIERWMHEFGISKTSKDGTTSLCLKCLERQKMKKNHNLKQKRALEKLIFEILIDNLPSQPEKDVKTITKKLVKYILFIGNFELKNNNKE